MAQTIKSSVKKTAKRSAKKPVRKKTASKKIAKKKINKPASRVQLTTTIAPTSVASAPIPTASSVVQLPMAMPKQEAVQPNTVGHLKVWMAAGLACIGIVAVWFFSLQFRDLQPLSASVNLNGTLNNLEVDDFMSDIQNEWSAFQENVTGLEDTATTSTTNATTTPSTKELNALFSAPAN